MFGYVPLKTPEVAQEFYIVCASVLASHKGYEFNKDKGVCYPIQDTLAQYYRALYILIVGDYDERDKRQVSGLTLSDYYSTYYEHIEALYNGNKGKDAFVRLSEYERFIFIFRDGILRTAASTVNATLRQNGLDADKINKFEKLFIADFTRNISCIIDQFTTLNTTKKEVWISLYNYAFDMPQVLEGIRKQINMANTTFFRNNSKDDIDESVLDYLREKYKSPYTEYNKAFAIAGIIIAHFRDRLFQTWMGMYAGLISASSSIVQDSEGNWQQLADTQEKMFNTGVRTTIDGFEELMSSIEAGSALYTVGNLRYYNLISWRQNQIRHEAVKVLLTNTSLMLTLEEIGLTVGGYVTYQDVAVNHGKNKNPDREKCFGFLTDMIEEAYNKDINSYRAKMLIDKWYDSGISRDGKNGDYPIDNSRSREKGTHELYNKERYKKLIKGIQALKILEHGVGETYHSFMSFPVNCKSASSYELLTGLSFRDYLSYNSGKDTPIIECDIECDDMLTDVIYIENVPFCVSRIRDMMSLNAPNSRVTIDSLTDDSAIVSANNSYDRELLELMRGKNINLKINRDVNSINTIVFNSLRIAIAKANDEYFLSFLAVKERRERILARDKVSWDGVYYGLLHAFSYAIFRYAMYGNLINGIGEYAGVQNNGLNVIDPDGNILSRFSKNISGKIDIRKAMLATGIRLSEEAFNNLEKEAFYSAALQDNLGSSRYTSAEPSGLTPGESLQRRRQFWSVPSVLYDKYKSDKKSDVYNIIEMIVTYAKNPASAGCSTLKFLEDICRCYGTIFKAITGDELDSNDKLFVPRTICLGVNTLIVVERVIFIMYYIQCLVHSVNVLSENHSEDVSVKMQLMLKAVKKIEISLSSNNGLDNIKALRMYEDVYSYLFETLTSDVFNNIEESGIDYDREMVVKNFCNFRDKYSSFVFMDSLECVIPDVSDMSEQLYQYRNVSLLLHKLITNTKYYNVSVGGVKYSLLSFINLMEEVMNLETRSIEREYMVGRVAINNIDDSTKIEISKAYDRLLEKQPDIEIEYEGMTWFESLQLYCKKNNVRIEQRVIDRLKLQFDEYSIDEYGFVCLNNNMLSCTKTEYKLKIIYFLTEFGVFRYNNSVVQQMGSKNDSFDWIV